MFPSFLTLSTDTCHFVSGSPRPAMSSAKPLMPFLGNDAKFEAESKFANGTSRANGSASQCSLWLIQLVRSLGRNSLVSVL